MDMFEYDYLITWWYKDERKPGFAKVERVTEAQMWAIVDLAHRNGDCITVNKIGACVIDWS